MSRCGAASPDWFKYVSECSILLTIIALESDHCSTGMGWYVYAEEECNKYCMVCCRYLWWIFSTSFHLAYLGEPRTGRHWHATPKHCCFNSATVRRLFTLKIFFSTNVSSINSVFTSLLPRLNCYVSDATESISFTLSWGTNSNLVSVLDKLEFS